MNCCVDRKAARWALPLLLLGAAPVATAAPGDQNVDLTLSLTAAGPFLVDEAAPIGLWVENLGPGPENRTVAVEAVLPVGLELTDPGSGWGVDLSVLPRVTWTTETTLARGHGLALAFAVTPRAAAQPGVTLVLTVRAGSYDLVPANDALSVPVDLSGAAAAALTATSFAQVLEDPVNGGVNPKAIPGAVMMCSLETANHGAPGDDGTLSVVLPVPAEASLLVTDVPGGSGPVLFVEGLPASGLSVVFRRLRSLRDDIQFSADGGLTFDYAPVADALGCDAAVTHLRVTPRGVFNGLSAAGAPTFALRCRVMVR